MILQAMQLSDQLAVLSVVSIYIDLRAPVSRTILSG